MQYANRQWILKRRPKGSVSRDDLELRETTMRELREGEILVRNLLLSLDPTNRIWMSDRDQYLPPVEIDDVMRGTTIGVVEASRSSAIAEGDIVLPSAGGWQLYAIAQARSSRKLDPQKGIPLTAYLSVLGPTGLTAYFGLLDVCQPRNGDTLVVSAAAGAVGSTVGQIARIKGCRVIGIAGGPGKCRWIHQALGFDAAIDYRAEEVGSALDRLCPDGVDINFENVGGAIMDAVFSRLRRGGRMALCGMISAYNREEPMVGPIDFGRILMNRLTVRGFIVLDYLPRAGEALANLSAWITDGKLTWKDHVIDGLEEAPNALQRLFTGDHDGKLIVKLQT
jgi:NADPH-dependent curcumin reductase CurA